MSVNKYIFHPYTRFSSIKNDYFPNIVKGEGVYLFDNHGNKYMDIISSWWACALGHNHPKVVAAIKNQTDLLQHSIIGSMTHPNVQKLADKLVHLMPTTNRHCLFASDGSSSIEAALKIALQYWHNIGKPEKNKLMGMEQAYHGDSLGALSVGFIDQFHAPYQHAISHSSKLPFPKPSSKDPDGFNKAEEIIEENAHHLAAVIVEPLCLGSAGMKFYSQSYLNKLAAACKKHDILLIIDEIAMGFGRTGKMFAFEHAAIDPDIVCIGKALTTGYMPLSSCIIKNSIYDTFTDLNDKDCTFYHGNTYAGHPIGCAAALAVLDVYQSNNIIHHSHSTASFMTEYLQNEFDLDCIENIRSLGMIGVVELKKSYQEKIPQIKKELIQEGYLFRPLGTTFYFMPPLVISEEQIKEALWCLKNILTKY
mgnify:CR=1 FL=1